MLKEKHFNYSDQTIQFGFIYKDRKNPKINIDSILSSVKNNIIIYDYDNVVLSRIASEATDLLNSQSSLFIALTSNKELKKLKDSGVKTGFIRSTSERANGAIIIVDKSTLYFVTSNGIIFESYKHSVGEAFDYINYLIWNTTSHEILQGTMTEVKGIRHSVVKPVFKKLLTKEQIQSQELVNATEDFDIGLGITYIQKEENVMNSVVIDDSIKSLGRTSRNTSIRTFDDMYLQVKYDDSIELASSFENLTLADVVNQEIWTDGEKLIVKDNLEINKTVSLPLNQYKDYEPQFENYIPKNQIGKYLSIDVTVDVLPIKVDSSYEVSSRYKEREQLNKSIDSNIDRLIKLFEDDERKLNQIKSESRLFEKAKKYNAYVEQAEPGLKVLKVKKNKKNFKKAVFNEKDVVVPSELVGTLFDKGKELFLAVSDEKGIKKAQEFLKENKLEATVVLA